MGLQSCPGLWCDELLLQAGAQAIQVFDSGLGTSLLLGAVGPLQFEVVAHRLQSEYKVDAVYDAAIIHTARWLTFPDAEVQRNFEKELAINPDDAAHDTSTWLLPAVAATSSGEVGGSRGVDFTSADAALSPPAFTAVTT